MNIVIQTPFPRRHLIFPDSKNFMYREIYSKHISVALSLSLFSDSISKLIDIHRLARYSMVNQMIYYTHWQCAAWNEKSRFPVGIRLSCISLLITVVFSFISYILYSVSIVTDKHRFTFTDLPPRHFKYVIFISNPFTTWILQRKSDLLSPGIIQGI